MRNIQTRSIPAKIVSINIEGAKHLDLVRGFLESTFYKDNIPDDVTTTVDKNIHIRGDLQLVVTK